MPKGVYTVNWRIVSRVDGHLTAGSFAFGVGEPVTEAAVRPAPAVPSNRSPLGVGGRFLLYTGLSGLLGSAWVGALVVRDRRPWSWVLPAAAWVVAALGLGALAVAQRHTTGAGVGDFLAAPLGRAVLWRGLGLVVAGCGLLVARRGAGGARLVGLCLTGAGAAGTVVAHVESGHAAAASWREAMVGLQSAHFLAAGAWIGGLAALLVALGGVPDEAKAAAARRFSVGAGVALGVLVVTGIVRAVDEVDGWRPLLHSGYGRLVLAKGSLLVLLAVLGGLNRRRNVPAAATSLRGLRRVGTAELSLAAGVFAVTGLLTTAPPPARSRVPAPPVVVVDGSDYATTTKVELTASPGQAGQNRFAVHLADFDSGAPVQADRVSARFRLPADPAVGETVLDLVQGRAGTYAALGSNLTLPGRWRVTLLVERGADSLELPLDLVTRLPKPDVTAAPVPGQPTIYDVTLSQGRSLQVYVDPERPGPTQLHTTFFSGAGTELAVDSATVTTAAPGGDPFTATPRRLGPGHFVADATLPAGPFGVEVTAITPDGEYLFCPLDLDIPR
jgi:copper transport protein